MYELYIFTSISISMPLQDLDMFATTICRVGTHEVSDSQTYGIHTLYSILLHPFTVNMSMASAFLHNSLFVSSFFIIGATFNTVNIMTLNLVFASDLYFENGWLVGVLSPSPMKVIRMGFCGTFLSFSWGDLASVCEHLLFCFVVVELF